MGYSVWRRSERRPSWRSNVLLDVATLKSQKALTNEIRRGACFFSFYRWSSPCWTMGCLCIAVVIHQCRVSGETAAAFHYYLPVKLHQAHRLTPLPAGPRYMRWLFAFNTCSSEMCKEICSLSVTTNGWQNLRLVVWWRSRRASSLNMCLGRSRVTACEEL